MKRSLSATFFIGAIAAGLAIALQKYGLLDRPETLLSRSIFASPLPNERLFPGNFILVVGLGFAVAWTMLEVREGFRRLVLLLLLIAELIGASWILDLAGISFQPVLGVAVALIAALLALVFGFLAGGRRRRATARFFTGRLAESGIARLTERGAPDLSEPRNYEVTFVYCEVGNQAALIDEMPAADYAQVSNELIAEASEPFLQEGGYLHAADGEGILRVLLGFPQSDRAIMPPRPRKPRSTFTPSDRRGCRQETGVVRQSSICGSGSVRASSWRVCRRRRRDRRFSCSGESVELARRLAIANQIYGSQILLGPRRFAKRERRL